VRAFNVRAFSPDGDCATRSHRRRFRTIAKSGAASLHLSVDLHQPLGNLRGALGLFGWRQSRFRGPIMGDGSTRPAMVIAGPARCSTGCFCCRPSSALACSPAGRAAKWSFATALLFIPSRGLKANTARTRYRVQVRALFRDGSSRKHTAAVPRHATTTPLVRISRCRDHSLTQHDGHQVLL
jgi:hypothetical protein